MAGERVKIFSQSIVLISRSAANLKDPFLAGIIYSSLERYIEAYLLLEKANRDDVAQYAISLSHRISSITEWLDAVTHYNLSPGSSPALARKTLLELQLIINKQTVKKEKKKEEVKEKIETIIVSPGLNAQLMEKIVEFVVGNPNSRPVEIAKNFPDVSERTVQRMLKELTVAGKLQRNNGGSKLVRYSIKS